MPCGARFIRDISIATHNCRTCQARISNGKIGHPAEYCSDECRKSYRNIYHKLRQRNYRDKMKGRRWKPTHGSIGNLGQEESKDGYYDDNGDFVHDDW